MELMHFIRGKAILIMAVMIILGGSGYYFWPRQVPLSQQYVTATVEKGALTQTVSANGALNPVVL
ncbi:MAG TPA: efflux RND transporter periplasmic adaptor subunit, partial [Mariprofundaceae bacterium]|nr:efflux RND transporter periplasmic adaptor subunit [Mariprofundaceae bacterium]